MPRLPRIDAPGLLHHVVSRGIERRRIFADDHDCRAFVDKLGNILLETNTPCYAWCLIPNHFHLVIKTKTVPLSKIMNRLLGGYAAYFNKRHRRFGHLFQNRFKSIVCQEDGYLLTLVRYIHLNPVRAKLIDTVKQLEDYPYSGHRCLTGKANYPWQDTDEVLGLFGKTAGSSIRAYLEFMAGGDNADNLDAIYPNRNFEAGSERFDLRILGDSDFTKTLLEQTPHDFKPALKDAKLLIQAVADIFCTSIDVIKTSSKSQVVANSRAVASLIAQSTGIKGATLARELGVTEACVSKSAQRGAKLLVNNPGLKEELMDKLRC